MGFAAFNEATIPWSLLQPQPCVSPAILEHPLWTRGTWTIWARFESPVLEGYHASDTRRNSIRLGVRRLSLWQFLTPSGPWEARSPMMLGMEPPSHNGLLWPQLVTTSAMGPARPVVASLGLQGCLLEGNTAFYRLWVKGIFLLPTATFSTWCPCHRFLVSMSQVFFPFPFLRQFQLNK